MSTETPTEDAQRPDWVCQRAIAWALDDAPVPPDLLVTLIAIARRCWIDGTGSFQSKPTLARKTGKSKDQIDADVKRLLDLGLIRLGDQTLPERKRVPAGQRPVVYDVALEKRGPKPARAPRNKTGKNKADPPTPGMDTTGGMDTRGGTDTPGGGGMGTGGTGGMGTSPTGGMDTPQRTPRKNPPKKTSNNPPLSPVETAAEATEDTSTPQPRERGGDSSNQKFKSHEHRILSRYGQDERQSDYLIEQITEMFEPSGIGWWITADKNGTLEDRIQEVIDDYLAARRAEQQNV